jgi:hypothetical protein
MSSRSASSRVKNLWYAVTAAILVQHLRCDIGRIAQRARTARSAIGTSPTAPTAIAGRVIGTWTVAPIAADRIVDHHFAHGIIGVPLSSGWHHPKRQPRQAAHAILCTLASSTPCLLYGATAQMCRLCRSRPVAKNPPHCSITEQPEHSGRYSFFQSLIDFTASGQILRSIMQS